MKRSTIITIVVIAIVLLSASTAIVYHRGNMVVSRAETDSEFDMDALETKKFPALIKVSQKVKGSRF